MTNYDNNPEFNAHAPGESSSTAMAIVVAALVLVVGAFLYFSNSSTAPNGQQLTGNQVTPAPAMPLPAMPPVTPAATPPADAPAANP